MNGKKTPEQIAREVAQITSEVRFHQERGRVAAREAVSHAIAIGELLVKARKELPPAEWSEWLQTEFGWSKRNGLRYCQLARRRSEVLAKVGPDASFRQALAALAAAAAGSDTRVTARWLVVGFLDAPPPDGAEAIELVQQAREWRVRKG